MEVNNQSILPSTPYQGNSSAPINVGEVGSAVIKERTGSDEAKVMLKGQEIMVKFDGPIPSDNRVLVEVKQQNDNGQFVLKPLSNGPSSASTQTVNDLLKKAGFDPSTQPELKEAVKLILSKGGSISKDSLTSLQDFLKNDIGAFSEKLDTIKIMQQKHIEFTKQQLHAVNTALHGEKLIDSLSKIVDGSLNISTGETGLQGKETVSILEKAMIQMKTNPEKILALLDPVNDQQLMAEIKKALQIQVAGKDQILQALSNSSLKESLQQEPDLEGMINQLEANNLSSTLTNVIQNAQKLEKIGGDRLENALQQVFLDEEVPENHSNSAIQDTLKSIQKEPSMEKVLAGVQTFVNENSTLDVNGVQTAFEKASQLANAGREIAARKELATAIQQLKQNDTDPQKQTLSKTEQYLINEAVQSLQLDSKNILVTQITKKLSQMAIDFKQVKREMSQNLDSVSKLIEGNKPGSVAPVKQMLDATIHKLDQTILKGDFMLYTDMATEKKMLTASTRLAEAKTQLNKGNIDEANQIVREVKDVVDKLMFKPSDNRVKHFISEQNLLSPKGMIEKAIRPFPDPDSGARRVFETVKALGLTHESDSAKSLIDKQEVPQNLKSVLLQMINDDSTQSKAPLQQALANITGQQLLNKQDPSGAQNLFMHIPILLNKQVANVKVFVNSQKKNDKIDWENCSLYFVLETKKLGDVGISISAVNRNLSITFKNNQTSFQQTAEPLMDTAKERLNEIGYHVSSLQFKPLNLDTHIGNEENRATSTATFTEKGYDFTI
jgi:hypothetical protein